MRYLPADLPAECDHARINNMVKIKIDNHELEIQDGTTILDAARQIGVDIPTMCYLKEFKPFTTCMVCMVKIKGREFLVPSCGALAEDGMDIETNTLDVLEARKKAVELLLSEHTGDCVAPCQRVCPMFVDIPAMIRSIQKADFLHARDIIAQSAHPTDEFCAQCKKPCESVCRRRIYDEPVSISSLMKSALDHSTAPLLQPAAAKATDRTSPCSSRIRKLTREELEVFLDQNSKYKRVIPETASKGYTDHEAQKETARCLHCDCRKKDACTLQRYADAFNSKQTTYSGERIPFTQHVFDSYIYEPGKCIKCGICVNISKNAGVPSGFTFVHRGFDTSVDVPFNRYENERLKKIIPACIKNCPTGALAHNEE